MRSLHLFVFLTFSCTSSVNGRHPTCNFMLELQRDEEECYRRLKKQEKPITKGCKGFWDNISCWDQAEIGETVTIPCPRVLKSLFGRNGYISKNCTASGWSRVFPNITSVCESEAKQEKYLWCYCMGVLESVCSVIELRIHLLRLSLFGTIVVSSLSMKRLKVQEYFWLVFYTVVKTLYTLGHSLSLIALTTGSAILCLFRKLHCTRNYIHLNLFFSFILRAVAVLVKDDILFSHNTQCSNQPSLIGCKASLVIFHYFIMANFFWLLVEGLYLHTLLMVIFSENRHFIVYLLIGWGFPTVFVFAWIMARLYLEDTGCWEVNENAIALWVINGPIMFSIMVNFILFISIIRILVQKLRCPDVGGNDQSQYRRLAKSTLLLIPLFGVHYVVFVSLNESMADYKIFFDLALGSFQGLVVAILYCFLNSEVQGELKRKWGSVSLDCHMSKEFRRNGSLAYRNGTDNAAQFHRNSRAQSLLQTETTVL